MSGFAPVYRVVKADGEVLLSSNDGDWANVTFWGLSPEDRPGTRFDVIWNGQVEVLGTHGAGKLSKKGKPVVLPPDGGQPGGGRPPARPPVTPPDGGTPGRGGGGRGPKD